MAIKLRIVGVAQKDVVRVKDTCQSGDKAKPRVQFTPEVPRYARRAWLTNGTGAAGLCEGKIAQLVEAEHERKRGLLFTVNSVSRANVISRPQRWPGFQPLN
jgi:hypothetical protein